MDTTENSEVQSVYDNFFNGIRSETGLSLYRDKKTIINYTKIPEHDVESSLSWQKIQPKIRRVADLPQEDIYTTNSVRSNVYYPNPTVHHNSPKRKIITIQEDKDISPLTSGKTVTTNINKATPTPKSSEVSGKSQKISCRYSRSSPKEIHSTARTGIVKHDYKRIVKSKNDSNNVIESQSKLREPSRESLNTKQNSIHDDKNISKNILKTRPRYINKEKDKNSCRLKGSTQKPFESQLNTKRSTSKETTGKKELNKKDLIIHNKSEKHSSIKKKTFIDKACETNIVKYENKNIAANIKAATQLKEECLKNDIASHYDKKDECQINSHDSITQYDSLSIPNIMLKTDKSIELPNEKSSISQCNYPLPNLKIPSLTITKHLENSNKKNDSYNNDSSYIISRATVTYTTEQKFDFEVVGSKELDISDVSRHSSMSNYPLNVVSLLKNENKQNKNIMAKTFRNIPNELNLRTLANLNDCELPIPQSWRDLNGSQLIKPSDVIGIMAHNNLFGDNLISEQFQKEVDFIDSFIESLQYLENYTLSKKKLSQVKRSFDRLCESKKFQLNKTKNNLCLPQTNKNSPNDSNLCLLNMLIRNEQRRAKNLLFVLKMREDALKNFTKSQIIWLENKKKHENTDSSALKKKQRGVLLKLQQECGEMEKIKKTLVSLSERRKAVLMKTKENIELEISKSGDRINTPNNSKKEIVKSASDSSLKCSSENDDIESDTLTDYSQINQEQKFKETLVEKSIQTDDRIVETLLEDQAVIAAAESFVIVDGSYLNIIFQNLTLPKMFFDGKQYEVSEEAISNILMSSNMLKDNISDNETIKKFMQQLENCESTPSTARSLVDEFDQYYKDMENYHHNSSEEKSSDNEEEINQNVSKMIPEEEIIQNVNDVSLETEDIELKNSDSIHLLEHSTTIEEEKVINIENNLLQEKCTCDNVTRNENFKEIGKPSMDISESVTPMLYELSMPASVNWQPVSKELTSRSTSTIGDSLGVKSEPSVEMSKNILPPPAVSEAEELRRQQLAIELEIKAIEQQQSLVVREIPDKPPPPYMPPSNKRKINPVRLLTVEYCSESKVRDCLQPTENKVNTEDPVEVLFKDFCLEKAESMKTEVSDKPWDACNLVPASSDQSESQVYEQIALELRKALTEVAPKAMAGLCSRRSDHTDDILYSEWRRNEKEWTTLQLDEAQVKNQLFESIFEQILTDSIDEYKKTVLEGNIKND